MVAGDSEVPNTDNGILNETMREYLRDPAAFEAREGTERAQKLRYKIRERRKDAIEELRYLHRHQEAWRRENLTAFEFPTSEPHVDPIRPHVPLPTAETIDIPLHEDTVKAMEPVRAALTDIFLDELIAEVDEIPAEFDSKQEFAEWIRDDPQRFRMVYDEEKLPEYEEFWGDEFVTYDDIIRWALYLMPTEESLGNDLEAMSVLPGINQDVRIEMLQAFCSTLERQYLQRKHK